MTGSGLQELLELVFAIRHDIMLTGKTISRSVCGQMLIDAAWITILVAKVYHIPLPSKNTDDSKRETARLSTDSNIDNEEKRSTG